MADDARSDAILRKIGQLETHLNKKDDELERDEALRVGSELQGDLTRLDEGLSAVAQDFGRDISKAVEIIAILQGPAGSGVEVGQFKSMLESFVRYARFLVEARQLLVEQQSKPKVDDDIEDQINGLRKKHSLETRTVASAASGSGPEAGGDAEEGEDEEGDGEGTGIDKEALFAGAPLGAELMYDVAEVVFNTGKGTLADLRKIPGVTDANVKDVAAYLAAKNWLQLRGGRVVGVNVDRLGQDLGLKVVGEPVAPESAPRQERRRGEPRFKYGDAVYLQDRGERGRDSRQYRRLLVVTTVELKNGFADVVLTDGDRLQTENARSQKLSAETPADDAQVTLEMSSKLKPVKIRGRSVTRGDVYRFTEGEHSGKSIHIHRVDRAQQVAVGVILDESGQPTGDRVRVGGRDKVEYVETVDAAAADTVLLRDIHTLREHRRESEQEFAFNEVVYIKPRRGDDAYRRVKVVDIVALPASDKNDDFFVVVTDGYDTEAKTRDALVKEAELPQDATVKEGARDRNPLRLGDVDLDRTKVKYVRTAKGRATLSVIDVDERHRCLVVAPLGRQNQPILERTIFIFEREFSQMGVQVVDQAGQAIDAGLQPATTGGPAAGEGGPSPDRGPRVDTEFEQLKQRVHIGDRYVVINTPGKAVWCYASRFDETTKEVFFETVYKAQDGQPSSGSLDATLWKQFEEDGKLIHAMPGDFDRFLAQFSDGDNLVAIRRQKDTTTGEYKPQVLNFKVGTIDSTPGNLKVTFVDAGGNALKELPQVTEREWGAVLAGGWVLGSELQISGILRNIQKGGKEAAPGAHPASGVDAAAEAAARAEAEAQRTFEQFKREHPLRSAIYIERLGDKGAYSVVGFNDAERTVDLKGLFGSTEEQTLTMDDWADVITTPGGKVETMMVGDYGLFIQNIEAGDLIFLYEDSGGEPQPFSVVRIEGAGDDAKVFAKNEAGTDIPPMDKGRWDNLVDAGWVFHHVKASASAPDVRAAAGAEQEDDSLLFRIGGKAVTKGQPVFVKQRGETEYTEWTVDKFTKKGTEEFVTLKKVSSGEELKLPRGEWRTAVEKKGIVAEKPPAAAGGGSGPETEDQRLTREFLALIQGVKVGEVVVATFPNSGGKSAIRRYRVDSVDGSGENIKINTTEEGSSRPAIFNLQKFKEAKTRFNATYTREAAPATPPPDPAVEAARLAAAERERQFRAEFVTFVQDIAAGYTVKITDARGELNLKVERVEGDGEDRVIYWEGGVRPLDVQNFIRRREKDVEFEKTPPTTAPQPSGETEVQKETRFRAEFVTFATGLAKGNKVTFIDAAGAREEQTVDKVQGKDDKATVHLKKADNSTRQLKVADFVALRKNGENYEKAAAATANGTQPPSGTETPDQRRERCKQEFLQWVGGGLIAGQHIRETTTGEEYAVQRVSGTGETATVHVVLDGGIPTPAEWNIGQYTRMREQGRVFEVQQLSDDEKMKLKYGESFELLTRYLTPGDKFTTKLSDQNTRYFQCVGLISGGPGLPPELRVHMSPAGRRDVKDTDPIVLLRFADFVRMCEAGYKFEREGAEGKKLADYPPGQYRIQEVGLLQDVTVIAHQDGKLICEYEYGDIIEYSPEEFGFLRPTSIDKENREKEAAKQAFLQLIDGLQPNTYIRMADAGSTTELLVTRVQGAGPTAVVEMSSIDRTNPTDFDLDHFTRLTSQGVRFEKVKQTPEQITTKEILEIVGKDTLKKWYKHAAEEMGDDDYEGRANELQHHLEEAFADAALWPDDKRTRLETMLRRKGYTEPDQAALFRDFENTWKNDCVGTMVHAIILMAQHNVEARMAADHEVKHHEHEKAEKLKQERSGNIFSRSLRAIGKRKWQTALTMAAGFGGGLLAGPMLGYAAANVVNRLGKRGEGLRERREKKHIYHEARERVMEEMEHETESADRLAAMISEALTQAPQAGGVRVDRLYGDVLTRMRDAAGTDEDKNSYSLERLMWEGDIRLGRDRSNLEVQAARLAAGSSVFGRLFGRIGELVASEGHLYDESKAKYIYGEICSTAMAGIIGSTIELVVDAGSLAKVATRAGIGLTRGSVEHTAIKFDQQEEARKQQELHHLAQLLDKKAAEFEQAIQHVQHEEHQAHDTKGRRKFWGAVKAGIMRGGLMAAIAGAVEGGRHVFNHTGVGSWMRGLVGLPRADGPYDPSERQSIRDEYNGSQQGAPTQEQPVQEEPIRGTIGGETPAGETPAAAAEPRPEVRGIPLTGPEKIGLRLGDFSWGPPHTDGKGFLHMANQLERDPEFKKLIIAREQAAYPKIKSEEAALHHFRVRVAQEGGYNWRTGTYDKIPLKGVTYSVGANEDGAVTLQADKGHLRNLQEPIRLGPPAIHEHPRDNNLGLKRFTIGNGRGGHHHIFAEKVEMLADQPGMVRVTDGLGHTIDRAIDSFALTIELPAGAGAVAEHVSAGGGGGGTHTAGVSRVEAQQGGGVDVPKARVAAGAAPRAETARERIFREANEEIRARAVGAKESRASMVPELKVGSLLRGQTPRILGPDGAYFVQGVVLSDHSIHKFLYDDRGTLVGYLDEANVPHVGTRIQVPEGLPEHITITDSARAAAARQLESARAGEPVEAPPVAPEPKRMTLPTGGQVEFRYGATGKVTDLIRFGGEITPRPDVANAFFNDNARYGGAISKPVEGGILNLGTYYQVYEQLQAKGEASSPEAQFLRDNIHRVMQQIARVDGDKSVDEVYKPSMLREFGFFSGAENQDRVLTNWSNIEQTIDRLENASKQQETQLTNLVRLVNMREGIFGPQGEGVASFISRHASELRLDPETAAKLARELPAQIAEMKRAIVEGISQGQSSEQVLAAVRRLDTVGDLNQNAAFFGAGGQIRTDASVVGQYEKLAVKVLREMVRTVAKS